MVLYNDFCWTGIKQGVQSSNLSECLSLDCVLKGQDIICLTFKITLKFQKGRIIFMQFPVPCVYDFLSDFVIKFFGLIWSQDLDKE